MKTKAAVLRELGNDFEIAEMDLDPPKTGEVLMRWVAAGLCHSDEHLQTGDIPVRYPIVGGHEGAGVGEGGGTGGAPREPGGPRGPPRHPRAPPAPTPPPTPHPPPP